MCDVEAKIHYFVSLAYLALQKQNSYRIKYVLNQHCRIKICEILSNVKISLALMSHLFHNHDIQWR